MGPLVLQERVGTLDAAELAAIDLEPVFRERPAIHRFPGAMAGRVHDLVVHVAAEYDGDAARVWTGADVVRRPARAARGAARLRPDEGRLARRRARPPARRRAGRAARPVAPDARRRRLGRRRSRSTRPGSARTRRRCARRPRPADGLRRRSSRSGCARRSPDEAGLARGEDVRLALLHGRREPRGRGPTGTSCSCAWGADGARTPRSGAGRARVDMTGRPMCNWVLVGPRRIASDDGLAAWADARRRLRAVAAAEGLSAPPRHVVLELRLMWVDDDGRHHDPHRAHPHPDR